MDLHFLQLGTRSFPFPFVPSHDVEDRVRDRDVLFGHLLAAASLAPPPPPRTTADRFLKPACLSLSPSLPLVVSLAID